MGDRRADTASACEQCGTAFQPRCNDLARGRGRFCSQRCKIAAMVHTVSRECGRCGTSFVVKRSEVARGRGMYCTRRCAQEANVSARIQPCLHCGKAFSALRSAEKTGRGKYCSPECHWETRRVRVAIPCAVCGTAVLASSRRLERNRGKVYCSLACRGMERRTPSFGQRGRSTQGAWSRAVRRRDGHTCRQCGTTTGRMFAHHIKSWAHYPELRHDRENGITLCKSCHWGHHRLPHDEAPASAPAT